MLAPLLAPRLLFLVPGLAATLAAQQPDWLLDPTPYVAKAEVRDGELVLDNGLLRVTVQTAPLALVGLENRVSGQQMLRAAAPLGALVVDGAELWVGGTVGQPNHAFLLPEWRQSLRADPRSLALLEIEPSQPIQARFAWRRTRPLSRDLPWPPNGISVGFRVGNAKLQAIVRLELYDGLPLLGHRMEVRAGDAECVVDSFTSVRLPLVEAESRVDPERLDVRLPNVYVETDYSFHAMSGADSSSHCVRWLPDPEFVTQVNYEKKTRCLLEVKPDVGPAQTIAPRCRFESFGTWLLFPDAEDRQRQTLAMRHMYRTLAPWSAENPLMMHVRSAEPAAVRAAIDQCAAVGFEMVILTFGSGFNVEDASASNLQRWRELAEYAHAKGVQLGGYSLLSSRRIQPDGDNCIHHETGKPGGQVFGHAPALASAWGQEYFRKLYAFYEHTGFDLLEHDGSYPGDHDAAARPPLQKGYEDSRWVQFSIIRDFYRWCRGRGIYLNVPDWYFLQGSNKTGMGYRETNWSLPRDQQVIHARQNLFDGTREKNPAMGWMHVPLTEYHGGGAAATMEPLAEHLPHYERMLASNLGYGAQACWRGPRLFDGEATRELITKWVTWYKRYRRILEADVIHGSSRRADGQSPDWVLHADPHCDPQAMLVVFNPTVAAVQMALPLDLYYGGFATAVVATGSDGVARELQLDRRWRTSLPVSVPAGGVVWYTLRRP